MDDMRHEYVNVATFIGIDAVPMTVGGRRMAVEWVVWEVMVADNAGTQQRALANYYLLESAGGRMLPVRMEATRHHFDGEAAPEPAHSFSQFTFAMN